MGKRRANGEGSIYETIKRNKRKVFLKEECKICKNCTDRTACNNRIGYDKCDKCKTCRDCLKYCDRFYCYKNVEAQIKHKSVARGSTQKEVILKKNEKEKEININKNIKNKSLTLIEVMKHNEDEKLKYNLIGENTYLRNYDTISAIEKHSVSSKEMSKLTETDIKDILSYFVEIGISQSYLEKVYDQIKSACNKCKLDELFTEIKRNTFISNSQRKEVVAFSVKEEEMLINYLNNNENKLVVNSKCNIDAKTIKNLIKFALATAMRIGELCSLNIETDIDMENKKTIVSTTLTRDKNGNVIVGTQTKTGRKDKKKGKSNIRNVPFGILFSEEDVIEILEEQIEISKNIPNNPNKFLFCTREGHMISHSSFNAIFKRICREAKVKLELPKGCHVHMTKHTAVSRMIEKGINIYVISAIVGTSVEVLYKTYAHIFDDFIEKEIEKSKLKNGTDLNLNNYSNNVLPFKPYLIK